MTGSTILVIDDEHGIALLCERVLAQAGFRVFAVTKPIEGIMILERETVDLLLVDIRMPEMDGFEVMTVVRKRHPDIAIVVMTGYGTVETALETLHRGADGLILKPFSDTSELIKSVQHALHEHRRKRDALRLQALRPLFDVTGLLFSETDPKRLQNLLLDAVCSQLRCEHAGMYDYDSESGLLTLIAGRGRPFSPPNQNFENTPLAQAVLSAMPVRVNAAGPGDPEQRALLIAQNYSSVVCAPVQSQNSNRVLMAARGAKDPVLSEADLETLVLLAHQAAVALENARLYEELRAYVRQVEESHRMLIQAEKMATVGRLTASIAHEINNPLQSVRNCLHLAGRNELPIETRQEYMSLAQDELERLMNTVQRMLEFYRPGALSKKFADINELIQRVLKLLDPEINNSNISIHLKLSSRLKPTPVVSDQIQQVILNLVLNAVEAMPDGGDIYLETRQRKQGVEIVVEDTGTGIPLEDAQKVFEPFVSSKEKGTGLGLTVSYGIITAHGGSLELINGRGKGACFRILLPADMESDAKRGEIV